MSENKVVLKNINEVNDLSHLKLSDGFVCDVETGICGPEEPIQTAKTTKKSEEKKNANNDLV